MSLSPAREPRVYRVSELNQEVARLLEARFGLVVVEGEISGWKHHGASGHCYFSLKDESAELKCALYRSRALGLSFAPADGMRVLAVGRLTVYPVRGLYQMVVERLSPAGIGELMIAFQRLKERLEKEGLFDERRKRALPAYPSVVGVVTSASGAAFADIRRVLRSRWSGVEILLSAVKVQGEGAAREIAAGIAAQGRHGRAQVVIVGRGGGSIEDLWAFNEEPVVRAIAASPIPIISAVGHETDVTLADLAADVRAATPSRAAELAVPDRAAVARTVGALGVRLVRSTRRGIVGRRELVRGLARSHGLHRPRTAVETAMQRVDDLGRRLERAGEAIVVDRTDRVRRLGGRLGIVSRSRTRDARAELREVRIRLANAVGRIGTARRPRLARLAGKLEALDPLRVLERGYALCARNDGTLVTSGAALHAGDPLRLRFHRGGAEATVTRSWTDEKEG